MSLSSLQATFSHEKTCQKWYKKWHRQNFLLPFLEDGNSVWCAKFCLESNAYWCFVADVTSPPSCFPSYLTPYCLIVCNLSAITRSNTFHCMWFGLPSRLQIFSLVDIYLTSVMHQHVCQIASLNNWHISASCLSSGAFASDMQLLASRIMTDLYCGLQNINLVSPLPLSLWLLFPDHVSSCFIFSSLNY